MKRVRGSALGEGLGGEEARTGLCAPQHLRREA